MTTPPLIPPATRLGHVHLTVADLERQLTFYQEVLGFRLHWQDGPAAGLGAGGADLLRLTQVRKARPAAGTTGLYHVAYLLPTQQDLAYLLARIAQQRAPVQGFSDHGTHYAIYLPDAEGNGIELAWDRPRAEWPQTFAEMVARNRGFSPQELLRTLPENGPGWEALPPQTCVGHVHLHVADLAASHHFYHELLGFGLPFDMHGAPAPWAETVIFFAAGDYHHHIGVNTWQGVGAPPPPVGATGLRYFTVVLPDHEALAQLVGRLYAAGVTVTVTDDGFLVRDPAHNGLWLTAGGD